MQLEHVRVSLGSVSEVSRRCLGSVSEVSQKCLGSVSEVSRKCLGSVSEVSRRCFGGVSEVSRKRLRLVQLKHVDGPALGAVLEQLTHLFDRFVRPALLSFPPFLLRGFAVRQRRALHGSKHHMTPRSTSPLRGGDWTTKAMAPRSRTFPPLLLAVVSIAIPIAIAAAVHRFATNHASKNGQTVTAPRLLSRHDCG